MSITKDTQVKLRIELESLLGDFIVPHNGIIAGGAVANIVINILTGSTLPVNDIDVFIPNAVGGEYVNPYTPYGTRFRTKTVQGNDYIQLIAIDLQSGLNRANTITELLRTFHLNCTQIAYDWHLDKLYYTKEFIWFTKNRQLLFNPLAYYNVAMNVVKAYKKHIENVGWLDDAYLTKVYGGENIRHADTFNHKPLLTRMINDPAFSVSNPSYYINADICQIHGNNPSDPMSNMAYENERIMYGNVSKTSRSIYEYNSKIYLMLHLIDLEYMRNKLSFDTIVLLGLTHFIKLVNYVALSRLISIPLLLQVVALVNKRPELYKLTFGAYLLNTNHIDDIQTLLQGYHELINTPVMPKLFKGQIVTINQMFRANLASAEEVTELRTKRIIYIDTPHIVTKVNAQGQVRYFTIGLNSKTVRELMQLPIITYLNWYRLVKLRGDTFVLSANDLPF